MRVVRIVTPGVSPAAWRASSANVLADQARTRLPSATPDGYHTAAATAEVVDSGGSAVTIATRAPSAAGAAHWSAR